MNQFLCDVKIPITWVQSLIKDVAAEQATDRNYNAGFIVTGHIFFKQMIRRLRILHHFTREIHNLLNLVQSC